LVGLQLGVQPTLAMHPSTFDIAMAARLRCPPTESITLWQAAG
jgi:hypothetical protein